MRQPPREGFPKEGFVRPKAVLEFVPIGRTKLNELEAAGEFPRRIHLSARCVVYRADEVRRWVDVRSAQRAPAPELEAA